MADLEGGKEPELIYGKTKERRMGKEETKRNRRREGDNVD